MVICKTIMVYLLFLQINGYAHSNPYSLTIVSSLPNLACALPLLLSSCPYFIPHSLAIEGVSHVSCRHCVLPSS